jgi:E3 ubiquitin-protein ligase MYCBP2
MPAVLTALQRSVHGVLLGKVVRPDWITHGMPKSSKIDTFHVKMSGGIYSKTFSTKVVGGWGGFSFAVRNFW